MGSTASIYLPQVFRSFQGFSVVDVKEWRESKLIEIILIKTDDKKHFCS